MDEDKQWTEIAPVEDLVDYKPGESLTVEIENDNGNSKSLVLVKGTVEWFAVDNHCTHDDGPLEDGIIDIEHCSIRCQRHGAVFDLNSGEVVSMPAITPIGSYKLKEENGILYIYI